MRGKRKVAFSPVQYTFLLGGPDGVAKVYRAPVYPVTKLACAFETKAAMPKSLFLSNTRLRAAWDFSHHGGSPCPSSSMVAPPPVSSSGVQPLGCSLWGAASGVQCTCTRRRRRGADSMQAVFHVHVSLPLNHAAEGPPLNHAEEADSMEACYGVFDRFVKELRNLQQ